MKSSFLFVLAFVSLSFLSNDVVAQCHSSKKAKAVQTALTTAPGDVVDVAISSKDHTTLVAAVKAAGLVETLKGEGPFTIFAPTNDAFNQLPAGTVEGLLKPESKSALANILTYHVIAGNLDSEAVVAAIKAGNGTAEVTAVNGGTVKAMIENGGVVLMDENGNKAKVTAVDLKGTNGVIHVIDQVILPGTKKK